MQFHKYQGTGNDFIILDGRNGVPADLDVKHLCDRRFGIGADGLMFLKNHANYDFEMVYYNSDGNVSSMCGNGGRCLAHFAHSLGIGKGSTLQFLAVDGPHRAEISGDIVALEMNNVSHWEKRENSIWITNTGSPHYVLFVEEEVKNFDLISFAKKIRYGEEFSQEGINVNVVRRIGNEQIEMRTYERGVEDETLSCGTGVTAAALMFQLSENKDIPLVNVKTMGGDLEVLSNRTSAGFEQVVLRGPAMLVYSGDIY